MAHGAVAGRLRLSDLRARLPAVLSGRLPAEDGAPWLTVSLRGLYRSATDLDAPEEFLRHGCSLATRARRLKIPAVSAADRLWAR